MPHNHIDIPERLREWLAQAITTGASDLHLTAGYPPALRLHGDLTELPESALTGEEIDHLLGAIGPSDVQSQVRDRRSVDFSFDLLLNGKPARFRAHLFIAGGYLAGCLRVIPTRIPDFDWTCFPIKL